MKEKHVEIKSRCRGLREGKCKLRAAEGKIKITDKVGDRDSGSAMWDKSNRQRTNNRQGERKEADSKLIERLSEMQRMASRKALCFANHQQNRTGSNSLVVL